MVLPYLRTVFDSAIKFAYLDPIICVSTSIAGQRGSVTSCTNDTPVLIDAKPEGLVLSFVGGQYRTEARSN